MIPYGRQDIDEADLAAVRDALSSDFLTQGPRVGIFEDKIAQVAGAKHAVAANSATSALHMAYLALGLGPGDILWTSPITFVATSNAALYCGAEVDFVDIDPVSFNLSVDSLKQKLVEAEREGKLPKIVAPVHLTGQSADMREIGELAREYGFRVVEDASHAIGASYLGEPVGNGRYSDITVFSFHPVKIITSGEGGMAVTNDPELAQRLRLFCSHGVTRDADLMEARDEGPWYYEQVELGYNYRMTDIQAALGASQSARLESFIARRHEIADTYDRLIDSNLVSTPVRLPDRHSSLHLYVVQIAGGAEKRRQVFEGLRGAQIGVNVHYIPVYHQPYYRKLGFEIGYCPMAEEYYSGAISIPMYPTLQEDEQTFVVDTLHRAVNG